MYNETIGLNVPRSGVRIEQFREERLGKICDLHYHDEIELLLVVKGSLSCHTEDRVCRANEGEIVFVNSRVPHFTSTHQAPTVYLLLQFRMVVHREDELLSELLLMRMTGGVQISSIRDREIAECMREVLWEFETKKEAYNYIVKSNTYRVIARLTRLRLLPDSEQSVDSAGIKRIRPLLSWINDGYASPLKLEEAAELLGLNPAYFCRLFRNATGVTFVEYLNYVRIRKSEALLQNTARSITDVSMDVGFSSVAYYNRVFKRIMNCTPSVYRKLRYGNVQFAQ